MDIDLKTKNSTREFVIVELDITCDGVDFKESEVMTLKELKVLRVQLEDARNLIDTHIERMQK